MTQRILLLASAAVLVVGCAPGDQPESSDASTQSSRSVDARLARPWKYREKL